MTTLADCRALDAQDPLRALRDQFTIPADVLYLDGNSLGVCPKAAPARIAEVVTKEWGEGLIRSWNRAGWYAAPGRIGERIARLLGAAPHQVTVTETISINLFKLVSADASPVRAVLRDLPR